MKRRAGELVASACAFDPDGYDYADWDIGEVRDAIAILRAVADGMLDRKHGVLVIAAPGGQGGGDG